MKHIYKTCGKISLLFYIFTLYYLWHLCQYGGIRRHMPILAFGVIGIVGTFVLWLISRRSFKRDNFESFRKKNIFYVEIAIFIITTLFFGGRIVYSGMKYNGALSWKIDKWLHQKEITLEHNNIFETGVEGILTDLDEELKLPEELYIAEKMQITFDKDGTVQSLYTFLYGKYKKGKERTYLIDYDADKSGKMSVWIDGNANGTYEKDMRLSPMIEILKNARWQKKVKTWAKKFPEQQTYEMLYFGRRSFGIKDGLQYISGDVDGDGRDLEENNIERLDEGGELIGFEVSLYMPELENVEPVRYIMEPEYISQEILSGENEKQQVHEAKNAKEWTVDESTGTMYFFLNKRKGWRLVVKDAAAGSRFYGMERTEDGGKIWETINESPFGNEMGVTEGLLFFDENFGVAGLTGASQSFSTLYITQDGGITFKKVELPMSMVTELPQFAKEYGFTIDDYDYLHMPEEKANVLTITVTTEGAESDGILFQSEDKGKTWEYRLAK